MARLHDEYLVVEQIDHSAAPFVEFSHLMLDGEVCLVYGELTFVDGEVECGVHGDEDETENDGDDEVPYLSNKLVSMLSSGGGLEWPKAL